MTLAASGATECVFCVLKNTSRKCRPSVAYPSPEILDALLKAKEGAIYILNYVKGPAGKGALHACFSFNDDSSFSFICHDRTSESVCYVHVEFQSLKSEKISSGRLSMIALQN